MSSSGRGLSGSIRVLPSPSVSGAVWEFEDGDRQPGGRTGVPPEEWSRTSTTVYHRMTDYTVRSDQCNEKSTLPLVLSLNKQVSFVENSRWRLPVRDVIQRGCRGTGWERSPLCVVSSSHSTDSGVAPRLLGTEVLILEERSQSHKNVTRVLSVPRDPPPSFSPQFVYTVFRI